MRERTSGYREKSEKMLRAESETSTRNSRHEKIVGAHTQDRLYRSLMGTCARQLAAQTPRQVAMRPYTISRDGRTGNWTSTVQNR